jgi:hypothetical protein
VLVGGTGSVGPSVGLGGGVSEGRGVRDGVEVIVGGNGVVVGINTAITVVASLRKANHPAAIPKVKRQATIQNSNVERVSRTVD